MKISLSSLDARGTTDEVDRLGAAAAVEES